MRKHLYLYFCVVLLCAVVGCNPAGNPSLNQQVQGLVGEWIGNMEKQSMTLIFDERGRVVWVGEEASREGFAVGGTYSFEEEKRIVDVTFLKRDRQGQRELKLTGYMVSTDKLFLKPVGENLERSENAGIVLSRKAK